MAKKVTWACFWVAIVLIAAMVGELVYLHTGGQISPVIGWIEGFLVIADVVVASIASHIAYPW